MVSDSSRVVSTPRPNIALSAVGCTVPRNKGRSTAACTNYSSRAAVAKTNHDNILALRYGAIERIFQDISFDD